MGKRTADQLETDAFLAQAEDLSILMTHPAWTSYSKLLTDMRQDALEELARCTDAAKFPFFQGKAAVIGRLLELPLEMASNASRLVQEEESEGHMVHTEVRAVLGMGADHDGEF